MKRKFMLLIILQGIIITVLVGCGSIDKYIDNTELNIADFYGEYTFDKVVYMPKSLAISDEQYQNDLKAVSESFKNVEFTINESFFYETSGTFGENPSEGFEFITVKDYGERYFDDLVREDIESFEGLSSIFGYDNIKKELEVNEIKHYTMYVKDGVLSNPLFYITKDNIYVAMETISFGDAGDDLKGYTHYLLKLKKN